MATIKTKRVPVVSPLSERELGLVTSDSFLTNCYIESFEDGRKFVVKRPGLSRFTTYNGGGASNGQGTFLFKGVTYAIGSNILYRLSSAPNGSANGSAWSASTSAPWTPRSNFGCIVFNDTIFVIGGVSAVGAGLFVNDVWSSNDGVNWTQAVSSAPWAKRGFINLAILGTTLYLIGGTGATGNFNDVWATPDGVNWTQVVGTAPWSARQGATVVSFNQGIFLMGGVDSTPTELHDIWFSPDGATWSIMSTSAAWSARHFHTSLVYNGKIWVFGGESAGVVHKDVWSSIDGITWTNTGNMPGERELMAAVVYANTMYFLGGVDVTFVRTTTVWSSTDGVTFTVVTATYGGNAVHSASLIVFRTPTATSAINALSMWLIGGNYSIGLASNIFLATINVALASTFSPATSASNIEQWNVAFQNAGDYCIIKNTQDAWVLHSGILEKITSSNYPTQTVPGIVVLDDTAYVMGVDGTIYGSNLSTPFIWSSLNFITADFEADIAIRIIKYQNYIFALKNTTFQLFQDAGRYPGSPLLPIIQYNTHVGCFSGNSAVSMRNTVVFAARGENVNPYVAVMNGSTPTRISTPSIEKLLLRWVPSITDHATSVRWNGHDVYILTPGNLFITIAYDFMEQQWYFLLSGVGQSGLFNAINCFNDGQTDYLQHPTQGIIYSMSPTVYQDDFNGIHCTIQLPSLDFGTLAMKFVGGVEVVGDKLATTPNTVTISWSDDDSFTFYAGGTVDLTSSHAYLPRGGRFRKRIYRLEHASNNPLRLEAIGLNIIGG